MHDWLFLWNSIHYSLSLYIALSNFSNYIYIRMVIAAWADMQWLDYPIVELHVWVGHTISVNVLNTYQTICLSPLLDLNDTPCTNSQWFVVSLGKCPKGIRGTQWAVLICILHLFRLFPLSLVYGMSFHSSICSIYSTVNAMYTQCRSHLQCFH